MTCPRCKTEDVERVTPRRLRKVDHHGRPSKQDYEWTRQAGFRHLAGDDGTAQIVLIPRLSCDCQFRARLRQVAEDLLPLVEHPFARREENRRRGLDRYLHEGKAA